MPAKTDYNAVFELYVVNNTYVSDTGYVQSAMVLAQRQPKVVITNNIIIAKRPSWLNFENDDGGSLAFTNNLVEAQISAAHQRFERHTNDGACCPRSPMRKPSRPPWLRLAPHNRRTGGQQRHRPRQRKLRQPQAFIQYVKSAARRRPVNGSLDIGAFEYGTGTTPGADDRPRSHARRPGTGERSGGATTTDVSGCAGVESSAAALVCFALFAGRRRAKLTACRG